MFYPAFQGANSYGQLCIGHKNDVSFPENVDVSRLPEHLAIAMINGGGGHTAITTGCQIFMVYFTFCITCIRIGIRVYDSKLETYIWRVLFSTCWVEAAEVSLLKSIFMNAQEGWLLFRTFYRGA